MTIPLWLSPPPPQIDFQRIGTAACEFHVSRAARDRYRFDVSLFSTHGSVIFADFHAARVFAQRMNERRDLARFPEQAVRAGQINALGLIDELLHQMVADYRRTVKPTVMAEALDWLRERIGPDAVEQALRRFADEFPPVRVYRGEVALDAYLGGSSDGVPHREIVLEEMLMLWLTNINPAAAPFLELFDDSALERDTAYPSIMNGLRAFFDAQPRYGPDDQSLMDVLRAPALAAPHSLAGQLEFLVSRWSSRLGLDRFRLRLLGSLDVIREEEKPAFVGAPGGGFSIGRPDIPVIEFRGLEYEPENFSPDLDWMPRVVLMAKVVHVWLAQLSAQYQRAIVHLDDIPDEELDTLARRGFTGLWLIGVWERSEASRRVKQMMGMSDAVASAYSLRRYEIAADLGGWPALHNLKARAWRRGIRLASDMVPNHMGIDSDWVINHPDWFIASDAPPFPAYSFNGPDLSSDGRVGIFLEDHYYSRSDAAVAFRRQDRWTGSARYIYHGNDGTSLPWNDTAQLDYLKPDVREAVIQTILHVARNFPIIRFDAAMTLAKKHFQRLWYPEPGTGGAIASRADFGLTRADFDAAMPAEFWREVVDRVAAEAPDTLLLAEAFWLMEGYFVRTLGMHRVYNSAFMNMLRDEDNAKYRSVMKNTLEFDPEVLKRYVNFMNNPDERTAIDQFGTGDKYFGVCTIMATLPGLPMFGHGQVEGFTEKYGMEFRRPLLDERPDFGLVQHHERVIFPLLHRRYLFAEVRDFLLYDFFTPDGRVDEDVFAHSNRSRGPRSGADERGLVVFHNRYKPTRGWIRSSAAYAVKTGQGDEKALVQRTLAEGLALRAGERDYTIFRDHVTGLDYIRSSRELARQGLYLELGPYAYRVFLDFREVEDSAAQPYGRLAEYLNGRGVPSLDDALRELTLLPVLDPFRAIVNGDRIRRLADPQAQPMTYASDVELHVLDLLREIRSFSDATREEAPVAQRIRRTIDAVLDLAGWSRRGAASAASTRSRLAAVLARVPGCGEYLRAGLRDDVTTWGVLLGWALARDLGRLASDEDYAQRSRSGLDEWLLGRALAGALRDAGLDEGAASRAVDAVRLLVAHPGWHVASRRPDAAHEPGTAPPALPALLEDDAARRYLHINRYDEVLWFNRESFEEMVWWLTVAAALDGAADADRTEAEAADSVRSAYETARLWLAAEAKSEYRVDRLTALADSSS